MAHPLVNDVRERMDKSFEAFQAELGNIRTGRATPAFSTWSMWMPTAAA